MEDQGIPEDRCFFLRYSLTPVINKLYIKVVDLRAEGLEPDELSEEEIREVVGE